MKRSLSLLFLTCFIFSSAAIAHDKVVVIPLLGKASASGGSQIVEVTSAGQVWMDRNLGALRAGTKSADPDAYGSLYQWGRAGDRHQNPISPRTGVRSNNPNNGLFITGYSDWRTTQDNTLWASESSPANPCPAGFRLPTDAEWEIERLSWGSNNSAGAFASPLLLVAAGYRRNVIGDGDLLGAGSLGFYWSSTALFDNGAISLQFTGANASLFYASVRADGCSVRCLKD